MMAGVGVVLVVMTLMLTVSAPDVTPGPLVPVNTRLRPRVMRASRVRSTTLSSAALFSPGHGEIFSLKNYISFSHVER